MPALHGRVLAPGQQQEAVIGVRDAVGSTHRPPSRVALQGTVLSWGWTGGVSVCIDGGAGDGNSIKGLDSVEVLD